MIIQNTDLQNYADSQTRWVIFQVRNFRHGPVAGRVLLIGRISKLGNFKPVPVVGQVLLVGRTKANGWELLLIGRVSTDFKLVFLSDLNGIFVVIKTF